MFHSDVSSISCVIFAVFRPALAHVIYKKVSFRMQGDRWKTTRSSTSLPAPAIAKCDKIGNCLHVVLLLIEEAPAPVWSEGAGHEGGQQEAHPPSTVAKDARQLPGVRSYEKDCFLLFKKVFFCAGSLVTSSLRFQWHFCKINNR